MNLGLLLHPGIWVFVIIMAANIFSLLGLLISFALSWTDDKKWSLDNWLGGKIYCRFSFGYGRGIEIFANSGGYDDYFFMFLGIFLVFMIWTIIAAVAGAIIEFGWPIALALAAIYFVIRGIRFARRAKKTLGKIGDAAHRHAKNGGAAKKVKVDTPEF